MTMSGVGKPLKSSKSSANQVDSATITFLQYVKLKKKHDLLDLMRQEGAKDRPFPNALYIASIFSDRVEFKIASNAPKNTKKPSIKKMKYSEVDRILPDTSEFKMVVGCIQGKNPYVLSFGFVEETGFFHFLNALSKARGWSMGPKLMQPPSKSIDSTEIVQSEFDGSYASTQESGHRVSEDSVASNRKSVMTTYVMWDEPQNTDLIAAVGPTPSILTEDSEVLDDLHSCRNVSSRFQEPRLEMNINHSACRRQEDRRRKAPAPVMCTCRTPQRSRSATGPTSKGGFRLSTAEDLASLNAFDSDHSTIYPTNRNHKQKGHFNRPSAFLPFDEVIALPPSKERTCKKPVRPKARYAPRRPTEPAKSELLEQGTSTPDLPAVVSDSSSGYTSETYQASELELTVDPRVSSRYVRNKRWVATGKIKRDSVSSALETKLYYKRPISGSLSRLQYIN